MDREMGLKRSGDHLNHHHTSIAISHGNQIPTSVSMVDSFPGLWCHSTNSQNLGFFENSLQTTMNTFIDPAARFSCFNGESFSGTVNPFSTCESMNPYSDASNVLDHGSNGYREPGFNGGERKETPDSSNGSEDSSFKGVAAKKKKKRSHQDMELEQVQGCPQLSTETTNENVGTKQKLEQNSTMANGKQAKDSSDAANDDYIHVRAKRGQATNSHSLAERVRRERISERMKYLQELVPGCSKVTGKAVMLDEIINYVQSLQRQIEFLSMKLAAINPRLDLNLEGLLLKDLQSRGGPSTIGFSPDMMHTQLHPSQQSLVQPGISDLVNHSDALRIAVHAQLTAINGYKEPPPQAPNAWDNQLHNTFQMTFGANPTIDTQEFKGKPCDGFPL